MSGATADLLDALALAGDEDAFYYEVPELAIGWVGLGVEDAVEAQGPGRFAAAERALRRDEPGRIWVGGFGFADRSGDPSFPAARWWRPRRLVGHTGAPPPAATPGAGPADGDGVQTADLERGDAGYRDRVIGALDAIARGELEKVVLARDLVLRRPAARDPVSVLRRLRARHASCAIYAVKRGARWFVGATPERLLRREAERVEIMALAGSARRGGGDSEDAQLRRALFESKKEQAEHAVAVRGLREALAASGAQLEVPESPEILRLSGLQHLCTRIGARWSGTAPGLLSLAGRVHPTAAVCGAPRDAARDWLTAHEGIERGWYAGLIGWVRADGSRGELSAALRCAQLEGGTARLLAGAGIVAGSDPEAEVRETRLKWNALLPALAGP